MANRGPVIVRIGNSGSSGGIQCCCFKCCTCINLGFLKSEPGMYKLAQAIIGSFCESLAINYGMAYSGKMGTSYFSFLTTASWCVMTTTLLLFCYVFSEKSFSLVRQSLFETAFNVVACFCYLSSTSYLGWAVNTFLYPMYQSTIFFQAYPAMTASYILGTIVGILHGIDAWKAYKYFKGYR